MQELPSHLQSLYPFERHYLQLSSGPRMHYVKEGSGEVVLMVHGNPTWSFMYRRLIAELKDYFCCVAPDHIGCGFSDKPQNHPYRLQAHIDHLLELVQHLDIKHFHLVVHDWGGAIGMAIAEKFPARLKSLVILNSAAFLSQRIPLRIAFCRVPFLGSLLVRGFNAFAGLATTMAVKKELPRDVKEGFLFPYDSWAHRIAVHEFIQDIPLSPDHPSYGCLEAIQNNLWILQHKPALLCWGMKDFCFTPHFLTEWMDHLPEAVVEKYPNAGHYILEDAADRCIPRIKKFLIASHQVEVCK